ncbi:putative 50S ribosomal subunit protein L30 [Candidatus Zinderia insecticola CARI]|uniref:Putative 50S ribosomal subunit protein L30 n=1 Tax=Zinderia insecticola (strain CARI) TaxID=871271 RepID=E0TJ30_ZINIC|nr:putative 50S ribosomal subunit protein L30 [Candidatus Zinderia insecticola CARI]
MKKKIKIKLIKSLIGINKKHRLILNSLKLNNLNSILIFNYNNYIIGIIKKIFYLLKIYF